VLFMERPDSDRNTVEIYIRRIHGALNPWKHSNRGFIDQIRKQILLWRSLRPTERERYIKLAHDALNQKDVGRARK